MKLTIFAATGGIGGHALAQATAAGHDVTAVVRDPSKISSGATRVIATDLLHPDQDTLESAVHGADAVLSGLGPRTRSDAGVASRGTRAIADAMRACGVRRILAVSAAPIGTVPSPTRPQPPKHDPGDGIIMRRLATPLLKSLLRPAYADLALMEELLRDPDRDLDWTVVRPPRLTNRPGAGAYRTAYGQNLRRGTNISRADVAHLMLRLLAEPESVRRVVAIAK